MNTLDRIQKTVKVFKILARVGMILSFVAALISLTAVGIWCDFNITKSIGDGSTILNLFVDNVNQAGFEETLCSLLAGFIDSLMSGVLLAFVYRYFKNELKDGTPFTKRGAKEVRSLGIMTIVLPIVAVSIIGGCYAYYGISLPADMGNGATVSFGIALILISFVFNYGAELEEKCK